MHHIFSMFFIDPQHMVDLCVAVFVRCILSGNLLSRQQWFESDHVVSIEEPNKQAYIR